MEEINASIGFDRKLYAQDIQGSLAHAAMLAKTGIIAAEDHKQIENGLKTIRKEIEEGKFTFLAQARRHSHEHRGAAGGMIRPCRRRLHTARSRNDQVAVDFRLWVKQELEKPQPPSNLIEAFLERAEDHAATVMPGFTHLRPRSPSPSAITAWPMWKCSAATFRACATPSSAG
ncbi:lyase family protein [Brucella abortus]|nr:lyase family protein [Brucella abortus]